MLAKLTVKLVALLVFILIVDPSDLLFHLKMPIFLLIFMVWIMEKFISKNKIRLNRDIGLMILLFLMIPVFGIMSGLMQNNIEDMEAGMGFVKSFFMIILLFVVIDRDIVVHKYIVKYSLIIPVIIFPIYLILGWNPALFKSISTFLVDQKNVAVFSMRDFYGYTAIMLFYRTCPLLVFPLAYYIDNFLKYKKIADFILFAVVFLTLILSGTRANMVSAVMLPVGIFMYHLLNRRRFIVLSGILFTLVYSLFLFFNSISDKKSDESVDIKSGHYKSIMALFDAHPQILLWGQGLGSMYYSVGSKMRIVQSELTYLELVRFFGIPLTIVLIAIMVYPLFCLYHKNVDPRSRYTLFAYMGYLFIAGTNPLLISSTGIIVVIAMYSVIYIDRNKQINRTTYTQLN